MTGNKKILITSALPYVNNVPHLGNIIGCVLSADVYARYKRQCGEDVIYVCGTDEYGTTTEIKAKQENLTCQELCDKYHELHKEIYDWFNISFDFFGRTTTDTHTEMTHQIFTELYNNGHIEEKTTTQFYCGTCDMFLADRYIKGTCYYKECKGKNIITKCDQCDSCSNLIETDKIIDPFCAMCNNEPISKQTDHLHIKLGDFQDKLKKYSDKDIFMTDNAKHITNSWLRNNNNKLHSRCITRDLKWGTKVPIIDDSLEKYKDKVFYVWFDATIGYYSILKHGMKQSSNYNDADIEAWLNNNNNTINLVQFMAKDNVPFHTVVFPATLFGADLNYPVINKLSSTEYLNYESDKFSKSNNVGVFGDDAINISDNLDITEDYWRYYLLKNRPETNDVSFSWKNFITLCNADLVKNYGNFANRCISMTRRYLNGDTKIDISDKHDEYKDYIDNILKCATDYHEQMNSFKFKDALLSVFLISSFGNKFLQQYQPWAIMSNKDNKNKDNQNDPQVLKEINSILGFSTWILYFTSLYLTPFIPKSSKYIIDYINVNFNFDSIKDVENTKFTSPELFLRCIGKNVTSSLLKTRYTMPFKVLKESDVNLALVDSNISTSTLGV